MTKREEPEGFAEFWAVWRPYARHTDGRGLARDCYAKLIKNGADPADIVDGAKYFFRTMKDRDRDYVPLAATWLNRGAFEDMAVQERELQTRISERQSKREEPANVVPIDREKRHEMAAKARELIKSAVAQ